MIPIIDISHLFSTNLEHTHSVFDEIHFACTKVGFFYIKNHGISKELISQVYALSKEFFAQSSNVKNIYNISKSKHHLGYTALGEETLQETLAGDDKESFDICPFLETSEIIPTPNVKNFQSITSKYFYALHSLSHRLLHAMAMALGEPKNVFSKHVNGNAIKLRLLHYPQNHYGKTIAGEHTDYGCFTLLHQDDIGGLQVKNTQGNWIDATPIEGTFVVNIGDLMQRWTNNKYVSTLHRVKSPTTRQNRYSIPFFVEPDLETVVSCLPSCISKEAPSQYNDILAEKWINAKFDASYRYRQKNFM